MQREEDKGIKEGRETQGTERPTMRIKHALSGAEIAITARTDRLSTPEYDTGEVERIKAFCQSCRLREENRIDLPVIPLT